jgi:exopolyphosphatase/guanosine-5'-triphosphate,3'-diphosphate pyrophosphatase
MRAVVDIGSNSVKVLVAKIQRGVLEPVATLSRVTRLGKGLEASSLLSPDSLAATKVAFADFAKLLAQHPVEELIIVATEAVRAAKNQEQMRELVQEAFKSPLRILTGEEEAHYSFAGASLVAKLEALPLEELAFLDLGGASTEVGVLKPQRLFQSFAIGAVRAFEKTGMLPGPIPDAVWNLAKFKLNQSFRSLEISKFLSQLGSRKHGVVVGGTMLQAAKALSARAISKEVFHCSVADLKAFNEKFRSLSIEERISRYGVEEGRADILPAGVLVTTEILDALRIESLYVTSWGLRHGLLLAADDH